MNIELTPEERADLARRLGNMALTLYPGTAGDSPSPIIDTWDVSSLVANIMAARQPQTPAAWTPKYGLAYYWISEFSEVEGGTWWDCDIDRMRKRAGNCYPDQATAEKVLQFRQARERADEIAAKYRGDWKPEPGAAVWQTLLFVDGFSTVIGTPGHPWSFRNKALAEMFRAELGDDTLFLILTGHPREDS